jgi:type VI secretion system secreted protein Hcp
VLLNCARRCGHTWKAERFRQPITIRNACRGARVGLDRGLRIKNMAIFLKYGALKGEVTQETHKEWIEVNSLQWGVGRGIGSGVGGGSLREATAPSVSEVTISKIMDISSPLLLKEAIGGKAVEVKIELTQTDASGKHVSFQKYILTNTLVSGYSISSGGDRPSESLSFNFTKFDSEYMNIDDQFAAKTTGHVIYDIALAKLS